MDRRSFLMLSLSGAAAITIADNAAARPNITTDAAPGVNFQSYKTFTWANQAPPRGMDPVAYDRIRQTIENSLATKGYQRADAGDLSLILSIGAREKTEFESWGRFGLQQDVYQYTQGMLKLDAFDTQTRQAVWHGQASETINPEKPNYTAINDGVAKMMAQFPAGGGAASAAPAPPPP